jgi:hypothetical protein
MVEALLNTKPGVWPAESVDPDRPYKCQTRRIVKPQPVSAAGDTYSWKGDIQGPKTLLLTLLKHAPCETGDILWVRETFNVNPKYKNVECGHCKACKDTKEDYIYRATFPVNEEGITYYPCRGWKPSIYMPREAARLFLEVKDVRAERLQEMVFNDIEKEGIALEPLPSCFEKGRPYGWEKWSEAQKDGYCKSEARADYIAFFSWKDKNFNIFENLWDSLNDKSGYGWDKNPWVWVIEFTRLDPEEAQRKEAAVCAR